MRHINGLTWGACLILTGSAVGVPQASPLPGDVEALAGRVTVTTRTYFTVQVLVDGAPPSSAEPRPGATMEMKLVALEPPPESQLLLIFAFDPEREIVTLRPVSIAPEHADRMYANPTTTLIDRGTPVAKRHSPHTGTLVLDRRSRPGLGLPTDVPLPSRLLNGGLSHDFDRWVNRMIRPGSGQENLAPYFREVSRERRRLRDGVEEWEEWHVAEEILIRGEPMRVGRRMVVDVGRQRVMQAEFLTGARMHSRWELEWPDGRHASLPSGLRVLLYSQVDSEQQGEQPVSQEVIYRFDDMATEMEEVVRAFQISYPPETRLIEMGITEPGRRDVMERRPAGERAGGTQFPIFVVALILSSVLAAAILLVVYRLRTAGSGKER